MADMYSQVSVPIRGLFNLTKKIKTDEATYMQASFRPHQGII